jgi:hypothetical protein
MTSEQLRENLVTVLKKEFPCIKLKNSILKSGNVRISPYIPNKRRNKRWMQLDANSEYLSIAMDHFEGDITLEDLEDLRLLYGLNGCSSAIQIQENNDAINISIFNAESYDFSNNEFVRFLHKHFESYLKLIS